MKQPLTPPPLSEVKLKDFDPRYVSGDWDKDKAEKRLEENAAAIGALAYRLYAEDRRAVLLVLQGMDTSGKDGTIRGVLADVNPQSCAITPFKAPTTEELAHDFLWRIHKAEPRSGQHRRLQPLALRGRARRARPQSRSRERVEDPLRPHQRFRTPPCRGPHHDW